MAPSESGRPLRVLIVGAGIGGLTAAIGLRREGHEVTIFEQSKFANETGAAIHLAPNCNGILRRLGIYAEDFGANNYEAVERYTDSGDLINAVDMRHSLSLWQHPYHLVHRRDLHNQLKSKAIEEGGEGRPAVLKLSSRIVDVDYDDPSVLLDNGERYQGDVVIGADGVHSKTRDVVTGGSIKPFGGGKSAFRFLLPRKLLLDDEATRKYIERDNCLTMLFANDRRIVIYPCQESTTMNFVAIHPSNESQYNPDDWNAQGAKEQVLEIFKDFDESILAILSKIDPTNLKLWALLDMEPLDSWTKGKLALMGDAAHPFLPHLAQGGGQAIEDAASLVVLLHKGVAVDEIPERLRLYEKCRMERANRIQEYTRQAGWNVDEIKRSGKELGMKEYSDYNLGHDEWDHTTQELRKWLWAKDPKISWRMPLSFGPMPGPGQDPTEQSRGKSFSSSVTASIRFKTSRTLLQNMFPTSSFCFQSPDTIAYATLSCTTLDNVDWLGGGGYSSLGLYLHGVQYTQRDGSVTNGIYLPVMFEDLADPIISGREELCMPKIFCSIDVDHQEKSLEIKAAWRGVTFGRFEWKGLEPSSSPSGEGGETANSKDDGVLTYRYVPAVGDPGKADAEYAVFIPKRKDSEGSVRETNLEATEPAISFTPRDPKALPTLHHVVARLAELPIYGIEEAKVEHRRGPEETFQGVRLD
ncbi:hypothetical protein FQN54_009203 [Arachnomyces sp. PD_36]|nr:hypothetical protein FQN54_009203 [Arachnomyces sp. PD_36]